MHLVSYHFWTGEMKYVEKDTEDPDCETLFAIYPSSAKEAKKYGFKQYFTGKPCKRGHIANRLTCDNACLDCMKIKRKRLRARMTNEQRIEEREHHKRLRYANPQLYYETAKKYTEKNKEYINERANSRYHNKLKLDPIYRLNRAISGGIWAALKGKKGGQSWRKFADFDIDQLKEHLEKQFTPEMTWENYGSYWELDHIKPKSLCETPEEAWQLKNLQPLTASQNASKQNRYIGHPNNPQWINREYNNINENEVSINDNCI